MAWQTVATAASDAILVITLLVFILQARAMRQQVGHLQLQTSHMILQSEHATLATRAAVYQGLSQIMLDVDRLFINYPSLRPYFYDNVGEPDDPAKRNRLSAIAETYVDMMDNFLIQAPHLEQFIAEPWDDYFRDLMGRSPAIRRFWSEHRQWYGEHMRQLLDPVLANSSQVADRL